MSASQSSGNGKGRPPDENTGNSGSPPKRKILYDMEILAVVVVVVIVGIVIMLNFYPTGERPVVVDNQTVADEEPEPQSCEYLLSLEHCDDISIKNKALMENMPELCDMINSEEIRDHCKRYFR